MDNMSSRGSLKAKASFRGWGWESMDFSRIYDFSFFLSVQVCYKISQIVRVENC